MAKKKPKTEETSQAILIIGVEEESPLVVDIGAAVSQAMHSRERFRYKLNCNLRLVDNTLQEISLRGMSKPKLWETFRAMRTKIRWGEYFATMRNGLCIGFQTVFHLSAPDYVLCDLCNTDYTTSDVCGGLIFCTSAVCPICAPETEERALANNETKLIKQRCPPQLSFAAWIRHFRQQTGQR